MKINHASNVRFEGEEAGEETLFVLRAHPITNLGWILTTAVVLILPIVVSILLLFLRVKTIPLSIPTMVLGMLVWFLMILGVAFQQFVRWYFNLYILTNKRIVDIDFFGLFHRRVSQCTLESIQDVTYTKAGILHNFLDYGDLHLQTAATQAHFDFISIPDPEGSQRQMLEVMARYRKGVERAHGTDYTETNRG
ncbi:MAG TPA: PH domain-containing protein [Candidatus Nanoarchaeia archaeon]